MYTQASEPAPSVLVLAVCLCSDEAKIIKTEEKRVWDVPRPNAFTEAFFFSPEFNGLVLWSRLIKYNSCGERKLLETNNLVEIGVIFTHFAPFGPVFSTG